jgi:ribosomal protein S18 acetylase RimI-like enzyme
VIESLRLELLTPVDWKVLQAARLEALRDSPRAFMSSYACELEWDESDWRELFVAATWMVAYEAQKVVGLARSVGESGRCATRHVESVWVASTHRRRGVCRTLLHMLAEMDRRMGMTEMLLWVLEDNHDAQRAYEAIGFKPTGERQFIPALRRFEQRLKLSIEAPSICRASTDDEGSLDQALELARVADQEPVQSARAHPGHLTYVAMPQPMEDVPNSGVASAASIASRKRVPLVEESSLLATMQERI